MWTVLLGFGLAMIVLAALALGLLVLAKTNK